MSRSLCASLVLALFALGAQRGVQQPELRLKEERVTIECTPGSGEAVLFFEAEAEFGFEGVAVLAPDGERVLELDVAGKRGVAVQGVILETAEIGAGTLSKTFPEGVYAWRARAADGRLATGAAELSHRIPNAPVVLHPIEGAEAVPTDLVVTWIAQPGVARYRLVVEQGETDGLVLELPGSHSSFQVPLGVLEPGTESHVEVGAVAPNGNCTLTEVAFTTR